MEVLDYCYGPGPCVYLHMTDIMKQNNPNAIQTLIFNLYLISTIQLAFSVHKHYIYEGMAVLTGMAHHWHCKGDWMQEQQSVKEEQS